MYSDAVNVSAVHVFVRDLKGEVLPFIAGYRSNVLEIGSVVLFFPEDGKLLGQFALFAAKQSLLAGAEEALKSSPIADIVDKAEAVLAAQDTEAEAVPVQGQPGRLNNGDALGR